jgi:cytochrome b6-f complex iron-sulfur subunit
MANSDVMAAVVCVGIVALTVLALLVLRRPADAETAQRSIRRRGSRPRPPAARADRRVRLDQERGDPRRDAHGDRVVLLRNAPVRRVPTDESIGVTRREFFNRGLLATVAIAFAGGASAIVAYLWPGNGGGFGGKIAAGSLPNILSYIKTNEQPFYVPEARTYIVAYPADDLSAAKASNAYPDYIVANMEQGIVALYQRCVHLGCRVPFCQSSQWFECPCHGSKYNRVGEKKDGPAPRGLDRFQALINGASVTVNTGLLAVGPPIGTNTTGQVADGPHCV